MEKYTQKELKRLVSNGAAIDLTNSHDRNDVKESYRQIGYSAGVYGCNGKLLQGIESGQLYAITTRSTALFIF
jgi:hypothetical protein